MNDETPDARDIDDPQRLAEEARENIAKQAAELRKFKVPIAVEPPTIFRP